MRLISTIASWVAGLGDEGPRPVQPPTPERLRELRSVCHTILDEVRGDFVKLLAERIDAARSANDFWHLRPRLFDAVSTAFGEVVAGRRLLQLDSLLHVHHDRRSPFSRNTVAGENERRHSRQLPPPAPAVRRRRATNKSPFRTTMQSAI